MHSNSIIRITSLCVGTTLALSLVACQTPTHHSTATNNVPIKCTMPIPMNMIDLCQTRHVSIGEHFTIELPSNPSTGYSWQLSDALDKVYLEKISNNYQPNPNPQNMVGSGGTEIWRFKALKSGESQIHMIYVRPWEPKENSDQAIKYRIHIK